MPHRFDPAILAMLRCPITGAQLQQDGDSLVAENNGERIRYPMVDDRPVLTPSAAIRTDSDSAMPDQTPPAETGAAS